MRPTEDAARRRFAAAHLRAYLRTRVLGRGRPEPVPDAAHRLESPLSQLAAEVADVDVDDVRAGVIVIAPDQGEELLAAHDLVRVLEERSKKLELARAQLDGTPGDACPARPQVERDIIDPELLVLRLLGSPTAPQPRPDPGDQL